MSSSSSALATFSRLRWSMAGLAGLVFFVAIACGDEDGATEPPPSTTSSSGGDDSGSGGSNNDTGLGPPTNDAPSNEDTGATGGLSKTFVYRDINHVLGTGQSLSVGAVGSPPLSTTQPYANQMFSQGVLPGATNLKTFAPLIEGDPASPGTGVETMTAAFANLVTKMARDELLVGQPTGKTSHDLLVSLHGIGGIAYSGLKKGTPAFAAGMAQAKAAFDLAKAQNKSFVVRAVTNVHGESDHVAQNAQYAANLAEWQSDYDTDVKAITGQTDTIPMIHTQMSSWTKYGQATSFIPSLQLATHLSSNGKIVLVGPKYNLEYADDGVHLTNHGYQHMGEYYAKVYRRIILEGRPWDPLRPVNVSRAGAVITIKFVVPVPPMVFDEQAIQNPGDEGFEYAEVSAVAAPTISKVAITGPDTVTITLSGVPTGTNKRIRYAFTGVAGAKAGPTTGARGNLRDSDATPSRGGYSLVNWCVHFDEFVP